MVKYFNVTLQEADDGSGDVILPFPEEFLKQEEWLEGDELVFKISEGSVIVINSSKEIRDRKNK
jgi:hypothetical protein